MLIAYDVAGHATVRTWLATGEGGVSDKGSGHAYPNPFDPSHEDAHIVTDFVTASTVTVKIYDFAGNEVRTLTADASGEAIWNGRSADDTIVANGVYFAYCKAVDGSSKVIKVVVIKR
jgi:hypothetical protein